MDRSLDSGYTNLSSGALDGRRPFALGTSQRGGSSFAGTRRTEMSRKVVGTARQGWQLQ